MEVRQRCLRIRRIHRSKGYRQSGVDGSCCILVEACADEPRGHILCSACDVVLAWVQVRAAADWKQRAGLVALSWRVLALVVLDRFVWESSVYLDLACEQLVHSCRGDVRG